MAAKECAGRFSLGDWCRRLGRIALPGVIVLAIITILYTVIGYAPFGTKSMALDDGNIQYLDFFAYLKDVLAGQNDVAYTFSKTLGGGNIAVFSYYLTSPFNLLVLIFDKVDLNVFFNLILALKLALAGSTFYVFLRGRFRSQLRYSLAIALSAGYALCQFALVRSSNVMWLDGVYMLPLMLLGVYHLVQRRDMRLLTVATALSILFNWYTGAINCIFVAIWLVVEFVLQDRRVAQPGLLRRVWPVLWRFCLAMLTAVLINCALLLPTLAALQGGRGGIDFSRLFFSFDGDFFATFQLYAYGTYSEEFVGVALFCGSLALICVVALFCSRQFTRREKLTLGGPLILMLLSFHFQPLLWVFSLFKETQGHIFRHSYLLEFALLFVAAYYLTRTFAKQTKAVEAHRTEARSVLMVTMVLVALIALLQYLHPISDTRTFLLCVVLLVVASLLIVALRHGRWQQLTCVLLAMLCLGELAFNAKIYWGTDYINAADYTAYTELTIPQIAAIKDTYTGVYRISQTSTRNTLVDTSLTANYNDAYGYNYWSIASYTSDPEDSQREFLAKLGYAKVWLNFNTVNTSILAADSLLGVKYLLSDYQINGWEPSHLNQQVQQPEVEPLPASATHVSSSTTRQIYENPYALPMAFVYNTADTGDIADAGNPFTYQNKLYSKLLGKEVNLYRPVAYKELAATADVDEDGRQVIRRYAVQLPQDACYAVYGNLPWGPELSTDRESILRVGEQATGYGSWLSPAVFYIPQDANSAETVEITLWSRDADFPVAGEPQFYALDLDALSAATKQLQQQAASGAEITNGRAKFTVNGSASNQALLTTIPYEAGWVVTRNGQEIEPQIFEGTLMQIPLVEGENQIELYFSVPRLRLGLVASGVGVLLLCWVFYESCAATRRRNA